MLEQLSADELTELFAFARREPLAADRAADSSAMLALVAARAAGAKDWKFEDGLIDYDALADRADDDGEQTPEEMSRNLAKFAALFA